FAASCTPWATYTSEGVVWSTATIAIVLPLTLAMSKASLGAVKVGSDECASRSAWAAWTTASAPETGAAEATPPVATVDELQAVRLAAVAAAVRTNASLGFMKTPFRRSIQQLMEGFLGAAGDVHLAGPAPATDDDDAVRAVPDLVEVAADV